MENGNYTFVRFAKRIQMFRYYKPRSWGKFFPWSPSDILEGLGQIANSDKLKSESSRFYIAAVTVPFDANQKVMNIKIWKNWGVTYNQLQETVLQANYKDRQNSDIM